MVQFNNQSYIFKMYIFLNVKFMILCAFVKKGHFLMNNLQLSSIKLIVFLVVDSLGSNLQ